jgi:hypothetical protein
MAMPLVDESDRPVAVTGPLQRRGIGWIGLYDRHHVAQACEEGRLTRRPPGESQTWLPEAHQGADGMRADEAQRSGHQDHARVPVPLAGPAASQGSGMLT